MLVRSSREAALGRYLKSNCRIDYWPFLTVTPTHEFASQFDLPILILAKNQKLSRKPSRLASVHLNEPAVTVDRQQYVGTTTTWTSTTAVIAATD